MATTTHKRQTATRDATAQTTPQTTQPQPDLAAMSATLGVPVTPEAVRSAEALLDAVNLDELVPAVVRIAIMERTAHPYLMPDGSEGTRYTFTPRIAEIALFPGVETQLKAMELTQRRRGMSLQEQMPEMLRLILEVWRLSEPDMTLERLQTGLDVFRVSKLYQLLFTPPSRQ